MRAVHKPAKILLLGLAGLAILYFVLLIPEGRAPLAHGAQQQPFLWNQDLVWAALEKDFVDARDRGCTTLAPQIKRGFSALEEQLARLSQANLPADDPAFRLLETNIFQLAPLVAACPQTLSDFTALVSRLRQETKRHSQHWNLESLAVRQAFYRLLAGARMALEEAALQALPEQFLEIVPGNNSPATGRSVELLGVQLRSGDILVSRGGAPTSALIARGNDYPGSFSHVALLHVDQQTGEACLIESHIECGVAVATLKQYLEDKKLRILALRLRSDLEALKQDPALPHRAAAGALAEAKDRHIPYDFTMDYRDHSAQFCSEVVSAAYEQQHIQLWMGISYISSPTVVAWLGSMGARHFTTQEPADLEFDPQLEIVAEWRARETLFRAHIDDAVTDVMLEAAVPGESLSFNRWLLPFSRLAKGWSLLLNLFGRTGPVPEGMNATAALRVEKYRSDHRAISARVEQLAADFKRDKNYTPPYWELIQLAERARNELAAKH